MASREKRPLAPSKSKQKANNNDSGLSSLSSRTKKGKTLPAYIFEAVATGSNKLSPKLESSLPRKKVIASLKCKKKLRATKGNLIKIKSTKNVPVKNLKRLTNQTSGKSSKSNLNKTRKPKLVSKDINEQVDCVPLSDKNIETTTSSTPKSSPKSAKKLKISVLTETPLKTNAKITKLSSASGKKIVNKNSIDLTIDEVVGMLSDAEMDEHAMDVDKLEGKLTRSKKILLEEHEIKKEMIEVDDEKSDDDGIETSPESQSTSNSRKRSSQRSLRNGKLRQLDSTGDLDNKKNRKLNLDDGTLTQSTSEVNNEKDDSCALTINAQEPRSSTTVHNTKEEIDEKLDEPSNINLEVENNNNSEHMDRVGATGDAGPNLRSKTKAKSTDSALKNEDSESDETKMITIKSIIEEPKKSSSMDQLRKDCLLGKLSNDKQPSTKRRSSLNIDVKKTMGSLYGTETTDGTTPTAQIDQMIKTIKLTIAKSIESKIYGSDKALGLGKSFEVPKIEEIVAPLSTETQKLGLDEQGRIDDKPNVSKIETVMSNCSGENSNSVPKVADTAKEIEKLVMGDIDTIVDTIPNTEAASTSSSNQETNKEIILAQSSTSSSAADVCQMITPEASNNTSSCRINENEDNTNDSVGSKEMPEDSVLMQTEEAETLETISREVERLVSETSTSKPEPMIEKNNEDNVVKVDENEIVEATECSVEQSVVPDSEILSTLNVKPDKILENTEGTSDVEFKCKVPENSESDWYYEPSTSGESSSSISSEMLETLEDKEQKKISLRLISSQSPDIEATLTKSSDEVKKDLNLFESSDKAIKQTRVDEEENKIRLRLMGVQSSSVEPVLKECEKAEENIRIIESSEHMKNNADSIIETPINSQVDNTLKKNITEKSIVEDQVGDEANKLKEDKRSTEENKNAITDEGKRVLRARDKQKSMEKVSKASGACGNNSKTEADNSRSDSDEVSVSGESISSVSSPILEANDDKAQYDLFLRLMEVEQTDDSHKQAKNNSEAVVESPNNSQLEKSIKKNTQEKTIVIDEDKVSNVKEDKKITEDNKNIADEGRRVLRARDKQKKIEKVVKTSVSSENNSKTEADNSRSDINVDESVEVKVKREDSPVESIWMKVEEAEPQTRTRRSRDVKKRKEETSPSQNALKSKRHRRESKKHDQQNKEETLLDNEVAKINENTRSFTGEKFLKRLEGTESLRVLSESGRGRIDKDDNRSKSENNIDSAKDGKPNRLTRELCENDEPKETENLEVRSDVECKVKISENLQKDSDEASTSGESTSSISSQILETPEDKARKETILRLLGLESLEKAAERLHHQKVKREQSTGPLKTVIRIHKDKERDKKRSRSPLKMVLKQGRNDGEGDSHEFYTIQKEVGTSGLGDSSSGANRKFSTNHRQSCGNPDEDNEEKLSKCPLIIPEKSSSFSIHPGRLCADVCCYCFGKFGSLDTPMHLAQMKSDERRKKILSIERHLTKDSCLCDACYRHVDRKANVSPTNVGPKPQRVHRQLLVSKCYVRDCRGPARHLVKRRWLHKIKSCVQNRMNIDINWEPSQHTSMSFCVDHYAMIERFLTCSLCTRRLARNATHQLGPTETEELNRLLEQQGIPIPLESGTFVCKLCRYFTQIQLKYKDIENMNTNHRSFSKSYRKRILHYNDIESLENVEDEESSQSILNKDKRKKSKSIQSKSGPSKSPDEQSTSEKSTPEPVKTELTTSVGDIETRDDQKANDDSTIEDCPATDVQIMDLESTVEKLKKRKALDQHLYSTDSPIFSDNGGDVVEILAMDKEVTLTRLPKRPRVSNNNDITPVVQRLGANPSISVRTLFPGEEEMGLNANVEFSNVREVTPQGWEKCATIIQYDRETKILWQELQRPYGNQSSFLRHLILLEKYYRSGDLVLAPNASRNAINYSTSVQNRLISYEGPEKMDEPITDTVSTEYSNSRRLSGGYVMERDRLSIPGTSALTSTVTATPIKSTGNQQLNAKINPTRILKTNSSVSIIKKPPPNLQRLSLPSSSGNASSTNGSAKRKDGFPSKITGGTSGGKVFQLSEPDFKRLQNLKKQKMLNEKMTTSSPISATITNAKSNLQYQRTQMAAQTQFQKHLIMQQEMLNRQSRGDFEPLICDVRSLANENTPAQNLLNNLNLPKSIQVTTKPCNNPIPILPKIPKSLTVIPQTVPRPIDK
ncbi:hypothetical protein PV326_011436 [Microctonus aethiopoides]|nr:hypothetical protein PV326_011436 [Microctonus aethiopoides]